MDDCVDGEQRLEFLLEDRTGGNKVLLFGLTLELKALVLRVEEVEILEVERLLGA